MWAFEVRGGHIVKVALHSGRAVAPLLVNRGARSGTISGAASASSAASAAASSSTRRGATTIRLLDTLCTPSPDRALASADTL